VLPEEQIKWTHSIREIANHIGFVAVGFTDSSAIKGLEHFLEKRKKAGYHTSFEERDLSRRVDATALWPDCKTVVALAYPLSFTIKPKENEGILARSAVGEDYHRILLSKLEKLTTHMETGGWNYERPRFQVDTGPLNERAFAVRAGIGWVGRNQQLIIPEIGSFVSLALMLLDQKLVTDNPLENLCGACQKCMEACPAQIIGEDDFEAKKCLSYLTQTKAVLEEEQVGQLGLRLFGCDTCQEACPHNQPWLKKEELAASQLNRGENLWEVLHLTTGEFKQRFKATAAGWRGKGILQRNAYFALKKLDNEKLKVWEEKQTYENLPPIIQPYHKKVIHSISGGER
jgi:epoxyqueuosine reductase